MIHYWGPSQLSACGADPDKEEHRNHVQKIDCPACLKVLSDPSFADVWHVLHPDEGTSRLQGKSPYLCGLVMDKPTPGFRPEDARKASCRMCRRTAQAAPLQPPGFQAIAALGEGA